MLGQKRCLVWNTQRTASSFQIYKENRLLTNYCLLNFYVCGMSIGNNSSLFHKSDMVYKIWQLWNIQKNTKHLCVVRNEDEKNFQYNGSEGNLQTLWCIQKKPCLHFIFVFCDTLIHYFKKIAYIKTLDKIQKQSHWYRYTGLLLSHIFVTHQPSSKTTWRKHKKCYLSTDTIKSIHIEQNCLFI